MSWYEEKLKLVPVKTFLKNSANIITAFETGFIVLLQLYRSPTWQTIENFQSGPIWQNNAGKIYRGRAFYMETFSLTIIQFMSRFSDHKSRQNISIFYAKCSYMFHLADKEIKFLSNKSTVARFACNNILVTQYRNFEK